MLFLGQNYNTVERGEKYSVPGSKTATLDLKGRRKGSVPIADTEEGGAVDAGNLETYPGVKFNIFN